MTQVPCRSEQVGRFPRWVGYLLIHRRELCHRCPTAGGLGPFIRWCAQGLGALLPTQPTGSLCRRVPGSPRACEHCGPSQPASAHDSTASVYTGYGATQYPVSMSHGGSWPQETPYGSGGHTSAGASPPQPSSSSPDLFNPHILTAQLAQQGKAVSDSVLESVFAEVVGGREVWVADSYATFHVTGLFVWSFQV